MRFFIGFIIVVLGFLLVWKANGIVENFGHVPFAEKYLGTDGGTRLFWKLIGILSIILGFMYMFGLIEGVIWVIFSPLFRGQTPQQ